MGQSLVHLPIHIVFSTRGRTPFLVESTERVEMHRYLCGIGRKVGSPVLRINGTSDHVHILCSLGKQKAVCDLLRELKSSSSKWARMHLNAMKDFHWQKGYGAFAVNPEGVPDVIRYIDNQESHHKKTSFKDEFRKLCKSAGLAIDERFVWE